LNAWLAVATVVAAVNLYLRREHPEWSGSMRAAWALAPLLPGLLYVRSCVRFVRGLDEFQRRQQLEAFLFAALGTLLIATVINVLNANGVNWPGLAHGLGLGSTFVVMFMLWLVGTGIAKCRYR
jgi:hypothetical protein